MGFYKSCNHCGDDIYLDEDEEGNWHAYDDEESGAIHDCRPHQFEIECKWCGSDIMLRQSSDGKWKPTELDGLAHFCDRTKGNE